MCNRAIAVNIFLSPKTHTRTPVPTKNEPTTKTSIKGGRQKKLWIRTSRRREQSVTVLAMGPRWSTVGSMLEAPVYGTSPHVGFRPTIPVKLAGIRTDPPWSPPTAMSTTPPHTCTPKSVKCDSHNLNTHTKVKFKGDRNNLETYQGQGQNNIYLQTHQGQR